MFGAVADKYKLYKQIGEPFKEDGKLYVMVQPPFSKTTKPTKVRFYTDAKHTAGLKNKYQKPIWELFGCPSEDGQLQVVRKGRLTEEQNEKFFSNWERGFNWKGCSCLGGCWYAPLGAKPIPGIPSNCIETVNWKDFYKEDN